MALRINASKAYASIILLMQIGGIFCSAFKVSPPADVKKTSATTNNEQFTARSLGTNCDSTYSPTCLKLDIISFVERLSDSGDFSLLPGLTVIKEPDGDKTKTADKVAEIARSFPNDPVKRLDSYMVYKVGSFLNSRSLKFKLLDDETKENLELNKDGELGRSARYGGGGGGGGGGKGGKKGGMGGLLAMGMMMKGMMASIAMGGLAMLAGKALMTSLLALLLSGIIGLKSLLSGGGKSTTYEIVAKPVYTQSHSHSSGHEEYHGGDHGYGGGHGGWSGRSLDIQLPEHLKKNEP